MILQNSKLITESDVASLELSSITVSTNDKRNNTHSLNHDSAPLLCNDDESPATELRHKQHDLTQPNNNESSATELHPEQQDQTQPNYTTQRTPNLPGDESPATDLLFERLDLTQTVYTQRTPTLPGDELPAPERLELDQIPADYTQQTTLPGDELPPRPSLPDPRLSIPPPGYARLVAAPTSPSVNLADEETKTKICKMEKNCRKYYVKAGNKRLRNRTFIYGSQNCLRYD